MALTISACATRGPIVIEDCPDFESYTSPLPQSRLVAAIQSDVPGMSDEAPPALAEGANPLRPVAQPATGLDGLIWEALNRSDPADAPLVPSFRPTPPQDCADTPPANGLLLLSGGGQWGAMGAGFMKRLEECGRLPTFSFISGVSTGALQAMFMAGATDTTKTSAMLEALAAAYAPQDEKEIVNRKGTWTAAFTGSVAGIKPLRKRIEAALCPRKGGLPGEGDCNESDMLKALARDGAPPTLMGFVHARTGDFRFVDVRDLAALGGRHAQQCITGAALASAGVPVFYQQVRIGDTAYMDGGVRQSVFETTILERAMAMAAVAGMAEDPPIYVVRNGPTTAQVDDKIDQKADALAAALRTQDLMVNSLEVGSIAALRLRYPEGPISLVTADGWQVSAEDNGPGCDKQFHDGKVRKGQMFNPTFMRCLQRFGAQKADRKEPWIVLPTISQNASGSDTD